jgi:hypothetical protein
MKCKVTIAVTVPAFAEVEIEAKSQQAAEQAVEKELGEDGWASSFWQELIFEPEWQLADGFRVVESIDYANP